MQTIDGSIQTAFSQQALDLQKDFCCNGLDSTKIVRWVGCKPGVYQGSKTIFSSEDLSFCSWYQQVDSYNFATISLDPNETVELNLDSKLLLVKAKYTEPQGLDLLESLKLIELGIGEQSGYVGMTIPFLIGEPTPPYVYRYFVIKDLFNINTESLLTVPLKLNNISPYGVTINILYAK
jgi:hypothetical protein